MTKQDTTPNQTIASRIQKLLALAKGNANENEASAAMAKVQELLGQYNLSMAEVESHKVAGKVTEDAKRQKEQYEKSAMYEYQRKLMAAVAEAHFCLYWTGEKSTWNGKSWSNRKHHVLVGREANVATAKMMFEYLNSTTESLAKDIYPHPLNLSKSALSWKEGCAYRLAQRLRERTREADEAQTQKAAEQQTSTGTSLMLLTDLRQTETDLNYDLAWGNEPGTRALQRAQNLAKREDPVVVKVETEAEKAKREKEYKKWSERNQRAHDKKWANKDMNAFCAGHDKGNTVGLDTQINGGVK